MISNLYKQKVYIVYLINLGLLSVLGDDSDVDALLNHSKCDICKKSDGSIMKFNSSYHFSKHVRSRAHMDRILQISQCGESVPAHLLPPTILNQEAIEEASDKMLVEEDADNR